MQNNLQEWDKQLKTILDKKSKNGKRLMLFEHYTHIACSDSVCSSELASRDQKLMELGENYSTEHKLKQKAEKQRDKLATKLVSE